MRVPSASASPRAGQPASAASPGAAAAGPDAPALAKDRLAVGATPLSKLIEVDANGALGGDGGLVATGSVRLDRVYMARLLRYVTRHPEQFGAMDMKWDAKSRAFAGSVVVKAKGLPIPLSGRIVPVVDGNQPGFRLEGLGIKLFGRTVQVPFLTGLATKIIARQVSDELMTATPAPNGVVRLPIDGLLREAEALPDGLHVDTERTRLSMASDPEGDLTLHMKSDLPGPSGPNTPLSDVRLTLDEAALRQRLQPLLLPSFQLADVKLDKNAAALEGQAEVQALSDVGTALGALLTMVARAGGSRTADAMPARATIPLTLSLRFEGSQVVLTPSLRQALGELEQKLGAIGAKPVRDGDGLRFDLATLGAKYGLKTVEAKPGQLEASARFDVGSLLESPILRGEK